MTLDNAEGGCNPTVDFNPRNMAQPNRFFIAHLTVERHLNARISGSGTPVRTIG